MATPHPGLKLGVKVRVVQRRPCERDPHLVGRERQILQAPCEGQRTYDSFWQSLGGGCTPRASALCFVVIGALFSAITSASRRSLPASNHSESQASQIEPH